jgi:hypothetical protein
MAVGMLQELEGVTADQYDQVNEAMGIADNPPEGLIFHTAGEKDGGMRIFDVWESAEALERFTSERLMPAVEKVMGGGGEGPPPNVPLVYELHNLFKS